MSSPLILANALAAHLGDPNFAVFDCRFDLANPQAGMEAYLAGHIPGASYAHLDHHLSGAKSGSNGRHPLPDRAQLVAFLRAHGVGLDTFVVAYDAKDGMYAARLWWLMRWLGHAHVAVLDGGLAAWQNAGLPTDKNVVTHSTQGDFAASDSLVATADINLVEQSQSQGLLVVDARAAARYRGEIEPLDRVPGHIPLAVNRPYTENLHADGKFLSPEHLKAAFRAVIGEHALSKVVHQCGSGVTACHNLLAMEVAGLTGSMLYPGSYSEWSSDPARPIATGPTP